jgi:multidrug efflux pump subunit AcrA (membrane-fusion protein)
VRHDKGTGVFLLKADNTLVWRPVKTGISNALSVEVLSGLNAGDRVAQPSDQPLKDGMAVTPAVP